MVKESLIGWTQYTWNIAVWCDKVSEGCKFCYMMKDMERYGRKLTQVTRTQKAAFYKPDKIKEPALVFTCSWTDFFHEGCDPFRHEAWEIIRRNPHLTFQILTKRPERILQCLPPDWDWGYPNVWLGITVENQLRYLERMEYFKRIPAAVRFLSLEPMLGEMKLDEYLYRGNRSGEYSLSDSIPEDRRSKLINFIDWVIVGGESGNETGKWLYRPAQLKWFEQIAETCKQYDVPMFMKQMGTHLSKKLKLADRHGTDISEFPAQLKIQEFPKIYKPAA